MIRGLSVGFHPSEDTPIVKSSAQDRSLKRQGVDMVRAAECDQDASRFQKTHSPQVNLLIAA